MVLGAGVFQLPFIEEGKKCGYSTVVVSKYADEPGSSLADHFYHVSTAEIDKLEQIARAEHVGRIIAPASDFNARVAAVLNKRLGLDSVSPETVDTFSDKSLFRHLQKDKGFLHPPFVVASNFAECTEFIEIHKFPLIIKPCRSSGSKGVMIISSDEQLKDYFRRHDAGEYFILEKFVAGKEYGCEVFVEDYVINFAGFTEKLKNEFFVPYAHILPSGLDKDVESRLKQEINRLIHAVGYSSGPLNLDVLLTDQGPVFLDAGARPGGNGLPEIFSLHTDTDLIKSAVLGAISKKRKREVPALASFIFGSGSAGIVNKINNPEKLVSSVGGQVINCVITTGPGKSVSVFSEGSKNNGYMIFAARTRYEITRIVQELEQTKIIVIDE